jgi:phosphatidylinositol alpha-1,6-mannosyltransferase
LKVLLISEIFPPSTGGSGRWFWEIYRRMPQESLVVAAGEHPRQDDFDRGHSFHLRRLPLTFSTWGTCNVRGCWNYVRAWRSLSQMVRKHQVCRIHCGRLLPEGWIARLLHLTTGIPYISYVHGEDLSISSHSRELVWMVRRVLDRASFVIANSRNTWSLLRDRWQVPEDRMRLLHPGVDVAYFVPAMRNAETRNALGWGNRPVVLTVGRLQKRKGHDHLIQAIETVRKRLPDVLYSIVGDGEERPHLERLVDTLGLGRHVQFLGEVDDPTLAHCYQQCDLFVLPNREVDRDIEGFGMVLLEAQACGKPVLAGDSGGTAETMQIPATGRVVPCEEPTHLAQAVLELLENAPLRAQMGEAGRRWVVDRFSWESLSRQALELFVRENAWAPASDGRERLVKN